MGRRVTAVTGEAPADAPVGRVARVVAPAKLTLSLAVERRRPDGFHDLRAEMVTLDLADVLWIDPATEGLVVEAAPGTRAEGLSTGADNLVQRALRAVGRQAGVRLAKHVPVGGGLGGGSTDAAAVLRWAGCRDVAVAAELGADVPFCVTGGRAIVTGLGEQVAPLPHEPRSFVLLVPPFGVDTGAVYRAWDVREARRTESRHRGGGPDVPRDDGAVNELTEAALEVEPRLAPWRDELQALTGRPARLAGSGSTWFVEGEPDELGLAGMQRVALGRSTASLIAVRTVAAGWEGPVPGG